MESRTASPPRLREAAGVAERLGASRLGPVGCCAVGFGAASSGTGAELGGVLLLPSIVAVGLFGDFSWLPSPVAANTVEANEPLMLLLSVSRKFCSGLRGAHVCRPCASISSLEMVSCVVASLLSVRSEGRAEALQCSSHAAHRCSNESTASGVSGMNSFARVCSPEGATRGGERVCMVHPRFEAASIPQKSLLSAALADAGGCAGSSRATVSEACAVASIVRQIQNDVVVSQDDPVDGRKVIHVNWSFVANVFLHLCGSLRFTPQVPGCIQGSSP